MTLIALIELLVTITGGVKDITEIVTFLQAQGVKPGDLIPAEHLEKVKAALKPVSDASDIEWDTDHTNYGG